MESGTRPVFPDKMLTCAIIAKRAGFDYFVGFSPAS
jgi:hypothetical protein